MVEYMRLKRDDYPVFHELLTDYYRDGEDADTEEAVLDSFIKDLFDMAMDGRIEGCMMRQKGAVIGFALYMIDDPDGVFSEIPGYGTFLEIGIRPPFRKNGYGREAVSHIERLMRQAGAEHFYVSVYPEADGFWGKCGYVKTEDIASNGLYIYKK